MNNIVLTLALVLGLTACGNNTAKTVAVQSGKQHRMRNKTVWKSSIFMANNGVPPVWR